MKALTKLDKPGQKKRFKCSAKKAELLINTYRETGGSLTALAKAAKISHSRMYQLFDEYPHIREEIDSIDIAMIEGVKNEALEKLRENVKAGLQRAIEYTLEKEPRKERGKIVINKDEFKGPDIELYLGVNQVVIE